MAKENEKISAYTGERPDILRLVPLHSRRILDVGCSDGTLGDSIKHIVSPCTVWGMELDPTFAETAKQRLEFVYQGDVDAFFKQEKLPEWKSFDCIIFADILEHLQDPWIVLKRAVDELLSANGVILISLPNIRFWDTLFNLIFRAYWPYRERGIHDRTHLRFFAKKNYEEMFGASGLEIVRQSANYRLSEAPSPKNRYAAFMRFFPFRDFFAFQYVFELRKRRTEGFSDCGH
ncbi:hypothetical protein BVY04_01300 [bacterium M21]|nr:hypothetical protein BVY04_01300 [bacterium M21]